ncbi:VapE domain-containing protein [Flavobacterium sp. LB3P21]|uniref:VapE domain-containing protein n=1 Tax=unclassified Flavobacterium TaxID=196869 RepID=UPI003AB028A5
MDSNLTTQSPQKFCSTLDKDIKVSYFKNAKSSKKTKDIFISEYLALVSDQTKKAEAERLRALPADEYKKAKLLKPCITGSCVMDADGRSLKNILFLNGLAVLDFDVLPNGYNDWQELKKDLENDLYTFIVHFSLSGRGLCVFVKIPKENNFNEIFLSFAEYYSLMFGVKIDFLSDQTRLRFIAFDSNPFYNPTSQVYKDTLKLEETTEPTQQDNDNVLDRYSNDPATAFNNTGLSGLEIVNNELIDLGYYIKKGRKPTIFEYQRAGGSPKSMVCFFNDGVVKFQVFSPNTGLKKENYNLFDLYKELKGLTDYEAQRNLAVLGFGTFIEPQIVRQNGNETYSKSLEFLEPKDIRLNQLTGITEIAGQPLNDTHTAQMLTELSLLSGKNQSKDILQTCLDVISNKNQFHPFLQFVKTLEDLPVTDFSKPTALDKLIDCFESSTPKELIKIYLIRWMLGLFDLHLLQRMTKLVLILSGTQNSGKTSFAKNILTDSLKMYGKVIEFNQNKMTDSKIALCSILIAVFDEFEDVLTKSKSLSDFKNLTSSYDIFERRAYRRNHEQMFRASIIMATTNEKSILNDSTGNTRFLTIDVKAFNLEKYFTVDLNLVWLEIYELHLKGETSVLSESERALQTNENINFESEDFIVGLIENSFHEDENGFVNTTEILIELEKNSKQHISLKRIGCALRKMDIERVAKKVNGKVLKGYNLKFNYES